MSDKPDAKKPSIGDRAADLKAEVADALQSGKSGLSDSTETARQSLADDMEKLRADLASMRDTLFRLVSQSGSEASKTAEKVGSAFASQMGAAASDAADAGAGMASSAREQAKTFAAELEGMTKKQPLMSLAGALLVGVVIGMMTRGRH